MIFDNR